MLLVSFEIKNTILDIFRRQVQTPFSFRITFNSILNKFNLFCKARLGQKKWFSMNHYAHPCNIIQEKQQKHLSKD